MEVTMDKLLHMIGSLYVELTMMRAELEMQKRMQKSMEATIDDLKETAATPITGSKKPILREAN